MKFGCAVLSGIILLLTQGGLAQSIFITEFMAANSKSLADEDGDFSNWIEIYNTSGAGVDLEGWSLTDDATDPTKWQFPGTNLAANGFMIVFASAKNRTLPGAPLHTNFKLAATGEYLALVRPDQSVAQEFSPQYPPQHDNLSYGLATGSPVNPDEKRFFSVPTPGATNTTGYFGVVADTRFNVTRGFFETSFLLEITCDTPGADIFLTTDGRTPDPSNGTHYTAPIPITTTAIIRAAAFKPGWLPTDVDTQSYFFLNDVVRQPGNPLDFPPTWGAQAADYAMDPRIVTNVAYAASLNEDLQSLPTMSLMMDLADLFGTNGIYANPLERGDTWERPVSVEFFDPRDRSKQFHLDAGLQILGEQTRDPKMLKHSFMLGFKSRYGATRLSFPLFPDSPVKEFDRVALLSSAQDAPVGTDASMRPGVEARDAYLKQSQLDTGQVAPHHRYAHLYLNGLYWGLYRLSERPDDAFAASYFGGVNDDYDALKHCDFACAEVIAGDDVAWKAMYGLAAAGVTNDVQYQAIQAYLDVDSFIDYLIVNMHLGHDDWPQKNWYATRRRAPGAAFHFYCWDGDFVLGLLSTTTDRTGFATPNTPAFIYSKLRENAEFRRLFGDRLQKHLFNTGALTVASNQIRFLAIADRIEPAIPPECARWGDANYKTPGASLYTPEIWRAERDRILQAEIPQRQEISLTHFRAAGLFPSVAAPQFNPFGGSVPAGFSLTMTHTNGSGLIFFTLDGSDPRLPGGNVAPAAQTYVDPLSVNAPLRVRARVLAGPQWSAEVDATFYPAQDVSKLRLTEIMYNPPGAGPVSGDEFEFLELKNTGNQTLDLSGLKFTSGISFTFTNGTQLAAGRFFVLVRNAAAFQSRYPGVTVDGVYTGKLDNGGETLRLEHPTGGTVWSITYDDGAPWAVTADGLGFSLVPKNANGADDSDRAANWRASARPGGSPGADDPPALTPEIFVNEVMPAPDDVPVDAIELFNPGTESVALDGWFLTDNPAAPKKFRIPDQTTIPPGGYLLFLEEQFNAVPGAGTSFSLSERGGAVHLFAANAAGELTGYSHGFSFGATADYVSFGRHVISTGEEQFPRQSQPSLCYSNFGPRLGPVVITEIHYHPAAGDDEFIELQNISREPAPLFDPAHPTNTWRLNGLGYVFATNLALAPNEMLLLVPVDPVSFRGRHTVPPTVRVVGPYSGSLQDSGERLELQRPSAPTTAGVFYITVDEVRYNDKAPWPPAADGSGPSLQKRRAESHGNDPINWSAAAPTPGESFPTFATPIILRQPTNQSVIAYQTAQFTVLADGAAPLNFQWRYRGSAISGATSFSLTLSNVLPGQAGPYSVLVFNPAGSVASAEAELSVQLPATISQQPISTNALASSSVTFVIAAISSTPVQFQWRFNGADLPGETSSTLTLANVQPAQAGSYTVRVTDGVGVVFSQPAMLTVLVPPVFLNQPRDQTVLEGQTATFGVTLTGTEPFKYIWRRNGVRLRNQTNGVLSLTNVQLTNAGSYSVLVTSPASLNGIASADGALTVLADFDRDGMADVWEAAYGFNTNSVADAGMDADGDGFTNLQEYLAGTDPTNALSYLKIEQINAVAGVTMMSFNAVSNRTYTVLFRESLSDAGWLALTNLSARPTNHWEIVREVNSGRGARYYRLVTPAVP